MPKEFIEAIEDTLESNSGFGLWFEDNCEIGDDFKIGKEELITASKMNFKKLKDELKKLDFVYNKDKMINKKRGIWEGFRIKHDEVEEIEEDNEEVEGL